MNNVLILLILLFLLFLASVILTLSYKSSKENPKRWSNPKKHQLEFYNIQPRFQPQPSFETYDLSWILSVLNHPQFYTTNFEHYYNFYQGFLDTLNSKVLNRSLKDILDRREQNKKRLEIEVSKPFKTQKIPSITHCIWISHPTNPYKIPDHKIERFFKQISRFPTTFTHYFWFYNLDSNLENVENLKARNYENRKIVFLDIVNESVITYGKDLFDIYYENSRYALCSDIVRYNLVYLFGGIYFDIGTIFNFSINHLLWLDYFSHQEGFINSNTVMACKPKNIVYYALLNLIDNLYRFKDPEIRNIKLSNKMVSWSSLGGYTWTMDNFLPPNEVFLPIVMSTKLVDLNHMASWVKGTLGQPSLKSQPVRPEEYMFSRRKYEPVFYSKMTDKWGRKFTEYFAKYYGVTMDIIIKNREKLERTFYNIMYNDLFPLDILKESIIPRILHKIWITHDKELSIEQLIITFKTYQLLKKSYFDWQFIFWTNDINVIPNTVSFLEKYCPNIQIREIDKEIKFAKFIYDAFLKEERYANANDIARANIIYKYGGLYIDMGIDIQYDISSLMIPFENIGIFHDGLIDSGIIGAKEKDPYWKDWLTFLDNREYKKLDKSLFNSPLNQMPITGAHFQMTLLDTKYSDRKILILQDDFYIKSNRMGSWYGLLKKSKIDLWDINSCL